METLTVIQALSGVAIEGDPYAEPFQASCYAKEATMQRRMVVSTYDFCRLLRCQTQRDYQEWAHSLRLFSISFDGPPKRVR